MIKALKTFGAHSQHKLIALDAKSAISINKIVSIPKVRIFFSAISKMGDGPLWYAIMLLLPLFVTSGWQTSLQMLIFGIVGVASYKLIKAKTNRLRPYAKYPQITLGCPALDKWSFPSGHTLHAVGFSIILCSELPILLWVLPLFTALIAASRVILGLHFISDVLIGAALGAIFASAVIVI